MFRQTKVVWFVLVFLVAFIVNFDAGMLINPFDPPTVENNIRNINIRTPIKTKVNREELERLMSVLECL
jgi:hypothetical protein